MEKETKKVEDIITKLFKLLHIEGNFEVSLKEDVADVVLETQDSGVVIGYHGEILESLQLIASLCVSKKIGRFIRVSIEVGDYKKKRTEWLENLAVQAKERVLQDGEQVTLSDLKAWERRIIHVLLQEDKEVSSESMGEGRERVLVIRPRSS